MYVVHSTWCIPIHRKQHQIIWHICSVFFRYWNYNLIKIQQFVRWKILIWFIQIGDGNNFQGSCGKKMSCQIYYLEIKEENVQRKTNKEIEIKYPRKWMKENKVQKRSLFHLNTSFCALDLRVIEWNIYI